MNKVYALVWNQTMGCWNVAHEGARRRCKAGGKRLALLALAVAGVAGMAPAFALPVGGAVVAGKGDILGFGSDAQMSINQHTDKMIVNWNDFSVGAGQKVVFNQPGTSSVALNRVIGTNVSSIKGQVDANGRVFIVNPNGIVVGQGAQINVGSLVATTKNIKDADFLAGNYQFSGDSNAEILNYGTIRATEGGNVALLGNQVRNGGVIQAQMGHVALGAGSDFTVNFDGNQLLNLQVNADAVNALAHNGGLLKADGGQVLMTAHGANTMLQAVVNNQGAIEAKTLRGNAGKITLDGGDAGTVQVGGALTANAVNGWGNGGVIETKGANVEAQLGTQVDTRASTGQTGSWLIASNKVTVQPNAATSSETAYVDTLSRNLANTNIQLTSKTDDLTLSGPVTWTSGNSLKLSAAKDLNQNGALTASGIGAQVALTAGADLKLNDKVTLSGLGNGLELNRAGALAMGKDAKITLSGKGATFKADGAHYRVVQTVADLQSIDTDLSGYYVLGNDLSNGRTQSLKSIGGNAVFSGKFDGLGNTISNLNINNPSNNVGLFASSSGAISNLTLASSTINGQNQSVNGFSAIGGLVGMNLGSLSNVTTRSVTVNTGYTRGENSVGGLVGQNIGGTINNALADGRVTGNINTRSIGGLVGDNMTFPNGVAQVINSVSKVQVNASRPRNASGGVGGLVGNNVSGYIADSSSSGSTISTGAGAIVGGLVGLNEDGIVERVSSSGLVRGTGAGHLGGLIGLNNGGTVSLATATGTVNGNGALGAGGLVGTNQKGILTEVKAGGAVQDNYGANVGGLIGDNRLGSIDTAEALGKVNAGQNARVGGLLGNNSQGDIAHAVARGSVTAGNSSQVGGLAGFSDGTLRSVDASGAVTGGMGSNVGGLVGSTGNYSRGYIESAKASGAVKGGDKSTVGGLVGVNSGGVTNSTASGSVGAGRSATLGGLVGLNSGSVRQSVASGKINFLPVGYNQVYGGLVGTNFGEMAYNAAVGEAAQVPAVGIDWKSQR